MASSERLKLEFHSIAFLRWRGEACLDGVIFPSANDLGMFDWLRVWCQRVDKSGWDATFLMRWQAVTLRQHIHSWMSVSGNAGLGGLSSLARVLGWFTSTRLPENNFWCRSTAIFDNGKSQQRLNAESMQNQAFVKVRFVQQRKR